jgi:hypothetical protein
VIGPGSTIPDATETPIGSVVGISTTNVTEHCAVGGAVAIGLGTMVTDITFHVHRGDVTGPVVGIVTYNVFPTDDALQTYAFGGFAELGEGVESETFVVTVTCAGMADPGAFSLGFVGAVVY